LVSRLNAIRVLERISDAKHHAHYLKGENPREIIKINALQDLLHRANYLAADLNKVDFA